MKSQLKKELEAAGAKSSEVDGLVSVAVGLKHLKSKASATQTYSKQSRRKLTMAFSGVGLIGVALGMTLLVFSQSVLPSSWLYPVQELSDNAVVTIHPDYRGIVMMKRAEQVKQLVADHADSQTILATLSDYQVEAAAYKSVPANYAAFEYCKNSLSQAASSASPSDRQAINKVLVSLNEV